MEENRECLFNYLILNGIGNWYAPKRHYGIGFASEVKFRCHSMEAINLAQAFEENYDAWAIIFWKIIWLMISICFLKLDEAKSSNCLLLFRKVMVPFLMLHPPSDQFYCKGCWFKSNRAYHNDFNSLGAVRKCRPQPVFGQKIFLTHKTEFNMFS